MAQNGIIIQHNTTK